MNIAKTIIGKINTQKPIVIWGAGISGLLMGYYLKKHGHKIRIKEVASRPGGKISTSVEHGHVIEHAANALFLDIHGYNLLSELKLLDQIIIPSKKLKRLIGFNDTFHSIFSQISIFHLLKNILCKTPPYKELLTLEEFFIPWLGKKTIEQILNPALSGIYASDCKNILLNTLFSFDSHNYPSSYAHFIQTLRRNRKNASHSPIKGTISFKGGMKTFIMAIEKKLTEDIEYNCKDFPLWDQENTILCTDALTASKLLTNYSPKVAQLLKNISYEKLNSHTLLLNKEISSLRSSFGALFTQDYSAKNHHILGILANHNIFPCNNPTYSSYTFISKKIDQPTNVLLKMINTFQKDINAHNLIFSQSSSWEQGLPLYNKVRYESVSSLHQLLDYQSGLCLFGNYVAGISMREMIQAAQLFANNTKNTI